MGKKKVEKTVSVKQCPFGHEAKPGTLGVVPISKEDDLYAVMCSECNAVGPSGYSPEDALEQWNKRMIVVVSEEAYKQMSEGNVDGDQEA